MKLFSVRDKTNRTAAPARGTVCGLPVCVHGGSILMHLVCLRGNLPQSSTLRLPADVRVML